MLGLDRVALLLEKQGKRPAVTSAPIELVADPGLGAALLRARAARDAGRRVRFGSGEKQ
jgi:hypothetical protein